MKLSVAAFYRRYSKANAISVQEISFFHQLYATPFF
jgi:hypothetical protein